jgi:hypothetical protein
MTPRQRLIRLAASRLREHNLKAHLEARGQTYELAGRPVHYERIAPRTREMTELIEGAVADLDEAVQAYYLALSDRGYYRLETAICQQL